MLVLQENQWSLNSPQSHRNTWQGINGQLWTNIELPIPFRVSVTCGRSVVFSGYTGFLHQENWPPRYNWNIVGVKHHKPPTTNTISPHLSWCNTNKIKNLFSLYHAFLWSFVSPFILQLLILIKVAYEPKLCYNINIGGISFNSYMFWIKFREYWRGNHKWTIQRNW